MEVGGSLEGWCLQGQPSAQLGFFPSQMGLEGHWARPAAHTLTGVLTILAGPPPHSGLHQT